MSTNFYQNGGGGGGGGGTPLSLGDIGSTPNAKGSTLTGSVLNFEPASATFGGVITTGAQTFSGVKTFSSDIIKSAQTGVQFNNAGDTFSTILRAGANTSNVVLNLPIADGTNNQTLTTNGTGQLSFKTMTPSDSVQLLSASGAVTSWTSTVLVTTGASDVTVTLPTIDTESTGKYVHIKKVDNGAGKVIIAVTGETVYLVSQYDSVGISNNGTTSYTTETCLASAPFVTVSSNTTLSGNAQSVLVTSGSGVVITLPTPTQYMNGNVVTVTKIDTTSGLVTFLGVTSSTALETQGSAVMFRSNGITWYQITNTNNFVDLVEVKTVSGEASYNAKIIHASGTITVSLPSTAPQGRIYRIANKGSGSVTVNVTGGGGIDDSTVSSTTSITLSSSQTQDFYFNTTWFRL